MSYRLSFGAAQNHYLDVEVQLPTAGAAQLDVFMPVWTPGSYMVREYSRQVEGWDARNSGGEALHWEKTRKNRWRIATGGAPEVTVRYRVYCHEMSVRNPWVDSDYALVVGAGVFVAPVEQPQRPYKVQVNLPPSWKKVETGLAPDPATPQSFTARDLDELLDCPILAGNPAVYEFKVSGVSHRLVNEGEGGVWDGARSAKDVEKIVAVTHALWKEVPYGAYPPNNYHFFNLLTGSGGGLEHKNSTVLMGSRWHQRARQDYLNWLSLVAHEFFHAWNVKTLRPAALGPFDYESEVYTPSLWIAEGFTAYYDNLLVRRAGFSTHKEYLEALGKDMEALQAAPGRSLQSVATSSYDAWIKFYRPDENSSNTSISYYTKGALVGFLLDARIREASHGQRCLDDVMRRAFQLYSGAHGYSDAQFRAVASEVAGADLSSFFQAAVDGTSELDYAPAMKFYGLRFKQPEKKPHADPEPGWMGAKTEARQGTLMITQVKRGTPAYEAGLNVDDEVLAVNDFRVAGDKAERLDDRLKQYAPGATVTLLVARRERLMRLNVRLGSRPSPDAWHLEVNPEADATAQQHRLAWLGADVK